LLEVMSLEVPAESARTVAGVQGWSQRFKKMLGDATEKPLVSGNCKVHRSSNSVIRLLAYLVCACAFCVLTLHCISAGAARQSLFSVILSISIYLCMFVLIIFAAKNRQATA